MKAFRIAVVTGAALCTFAATALADTAAERLEQSANDLKEIMSAPDKGIPQDLIAKAHCVVIVPGVKKAAFVFGGKFGKGFMLCHNPNSAGWGAPAAIRVEGGSFGFQIGASETDVVMLIMDASGKNSLLQSKFTLGGSAGVAAGPVGRTSSAETDAQMRAKILSYSRSRGAFAGIALNGATLRQDLDTNKELYGKTLTNKEIITGNEKPPAAASGLISTLNKYSRIEQG